MYGRRVVVTGMGLICPIGNSVQEAWNNARAGVSGVGHINLWDASDLRCRIAGEVKDFHPTLHFGQREARRMDRNTQLGFYAVQHAIEHSNLAITDENHYDVGTVIGTGIGGIQSTLDGYERFLERGPRGVSPLLVPMMLPDSLPAKVSIEYGLRGPSMCIVAACATGNTAIGEAAAMIARGAANAMVAGSSEAGILDLSLASFDNMGAVSRRNEEPQKASRPFDADRDGFVVAEGAGILVLEELTQAEERGAHIYAELVGYAATTDGHHITAPLETGAGAAAAMQRALKMAGLDATDVDYLNAHGTSTPLNDIMETRAIKIVFGEYAYDLPVSSTKSMTGHLLGAASAVEAIFSIMAIQDNFVPPTINLENPDNECDLDYVPHTGRNHNVDIAMSNAFGFGGHNTTLIFRRYVP